jgi:hypothetical protein
LTELASISSENQACTPGDKQDCVIVQYVNESDSWGGRDDYGIAFMNTVDGLYRYAGEDGVAGDSLMIGARSIDLNFDFSETEAEVPATYSVDVDP